MSLEAARNFNIVAVALNLLILWWVPWNLLSWLTVGFVLIGTVAALIMQRLIVELRSSGRKEA